MIGKIKGKLIEVDKNIGLIETTSGIFFEVYLPPTLISTLQVSSTIEVYTYLQVREDALILFGFESKLQANFFKMLLTVPGVGAKTAFTIISFAKIDNLIHAIKENDFNFFSQIPGIGKKTAMKIILELAQKFKTDFELEKMYLSQEDKIVIDALISLGYKANEAKAVFFKLPKNLPVEEKIKKALKMIK